MGRPKTDRKAKSYALYLDEDIQVRLGVLAKKIGISRNQLTANLISMGLEEAELMERVGLLQLRAAFERVRERIAGRIEDSKAVTA